VRASTEKYPRNDRVELAPFGIDELEVSALEEAASGRQPMLVVEVYRPPQVAQSGEHACRLQGSRWRSDYIRSCAVAPTATRSVFTGEATTRRYSVGLMQFMCRHGLLDNDPAELAIR
jgi:hypothetical protein